MASPCGPSVKAHCGRGRRNGEMKSRPTRVLWNTSEVTDNDQPSYGIRDSCPYEGQVARTCATCFHTMLRSNLDNAAIPSMTFERRDRLSNPPARPMVPTLQRDHLVT